MDARQYRIRELADSDYPAFAELQNRQRPTRTVSAESLREQRRLYQDPREPGRFLAVEEIGPHRLVGVAAILVLIWGSEPGGFYVDLVVDPDHEHRGVGRALAEELDRQGRAWGARVLRSEVPADAPRAMAFASAQGYVEGRRSWTSILELDRARLDRLPDRRAELEAAGIRFTTLLEEGPERPEVRRRIYESQIRSGADVPRLAAYHPPDFEAFSRATFGGSELCPEAYFLARVGDQYVGVTSLEPFPNQPETLHQVYTGTVPEFRGRGVATELKRRSLEYARAHGYRRIRTSNDARNERMWRINERLGYERKWPMAHVEKQLRPAPG